MKLYYDDKTRREEIYNLYQLIFEDPDAFAHYYFLEMYKNNRCLLLEKDGQIGAMLHQNPYEIIVGDRQFSLSYIVAVATKAQLRRQGCMRTLLLRTMQDLAKKGEPFTYLMPAKKEYYEPFDFAFIMDWYTFKTEKFEQSLTQSLEQFSEATMNNCEKTKSKENSFAYPFQLEMQNESNIELIAQKMSEARAQYANTFTKMTKTLLERLEKEQQCEGGHIFLIRDGEECIATGMYTKVNNKIQITNLLVQKQDKKEAVTEFLKREFSSYPIKWISYDKNLLKAQCEKKPLIMARILRVDILLPLLKSTKKQSFIIEITDSYLKHNNGKFLWKMDEHGSTLEKLEKDVSKKKVEKEACVSISIAKLTEIVFGYEKTTQDYLNNIIPLSPVHITEIV